MQKVKRGREFAKGVALFNAGRFFDAHEVWERIWLRESPPEKTFLQGLIQLAAAFHHYGRGNLQGARSLLASGSAKLDPFPADYRGVALQELRVAAREWVRALSAETDLELRRAPKIRLLRPTRRGGATESIRRAGSKPKGRR